MYYKLYAFLQLLLYQCASYLMSLLFLFILYVLQAKATFGFSLNFNFQNVNLPQAQR